MKKLEKKKKEDFEIDSSDEEPESRAFKTDVYEIPTATDFYLSSIPKKAACSLKFQIGRMHIKKTIFELETALSEQRRVEGLFAKFRKSGLHRCELG
ncbi:hypothetical protein L6303_06030 [archaeon]|nr:hypothetical protein [Nanoarchaeota archaeon]MBU4452143.1 hypothetical protein [Nanoarchaeota archaeon]MCG2724276.1 hypothetical protein [archaeon]